MSRNYTEGKIYKIEPIIPHDDGDVYIGSTTEIYLCRRFRNHKNVYKFYQNGKCGSNVSVFCLFDKYGIENCKIELIENVDAKSKDELRTREGHYIRTIRCVNKLIAGRSCKEWQEDNNEQMKEQRKQFRSKNRERLLVANKQYYDENREQLLEQKNSIGQKIESK